MCCSSFKVVVRVQNTQQTLYLKTQYSLARAKKTEKSLASCANADVNTPKNDY